MPKETGLKSHFTLGRVVDMKNRDTAALLFLLLSVTEAKWFERCELAKIMRKADLLDYGGRRISDWICLVFHESKFNSGVVGLTPEGGRSFGLFQINSYWWCSRGRSEPNFGCKMYCRDLVDDDIRDDIECAKIIASTSVGLDAWAVFNCGSLLAHKAETDCEMST
ncbi:lysozyme-like protein 1 [Paroedura picta]|uniref:lysozyme-like protein 1 n=1 Tax=Paroedura picta TaxID=143630 RepID=UPI00405787D2